MNEKGILKSGNTTLEKRDSDAVFRKCISNIWVISELYYGMISWSCKRKLRRSILKIVVQKLKRKNKKSADENLHFFVSIKMVNNLK